MPISIGSAKQGDERLQFRQSLIREPPVRLCAKLLCWYSELVNHANRKQRAIPGYEGAGIPGERGGIRPPRFFSNFSCNAPLKIKRAAVPDIAPVDEPTRRIDLSSLIFPGGCRP